MPYGEPSENPLEHLRVLAGGSLSAHRVLRVLTGGALSTHRGTLSTHRGTLSTQGGSLSTHRGCAGALAQTELGHGSNVRALQVRTGVLRSTHEYVGGPLLPFVAGRTACRVRSACHKSTVNGTMALHTHTHTHTHTVKHTNTHTAIRQYAPICANMRQYAPDAVIAADYGDVRRGGAGVCAPHADAEGTHSLARGTPTTTQARTGPANERSCTRRLRRTSSPLTSAHLRAGYEVLAGKLKGYSRGTHRVLTWGYSWGTHGVHTGSHGVLMRRL